MNNSSLIAVSKIIPAKHLIMQNKGSKGWRNSESTRLPTMWPWFKSWRRRHLWVELVVVKFSPLLREVFLPGTSVFPSP